MRIPFFSIIVPVYKVEGYCVVNMNQGGAENIMKQIIELLYEEIVEMGKLSHEFVASVFDKKKVVEETVGEIMI